MRHIQVYRRGPTALRGFTIIELMLTVTIAAILTAVAVPAFKTFVLNDRDIGQVNSLVSSFNYARSEAIKRDVAGGITVCPSVNGTSCSGSNWAGGWVVIDATPTDPPLQAIPALAGTNTLHVTGSTTGLTFLSSGLVTPAALTTITVCDVRGAAFAHELEVNSTGRVVASRNVGQTVSGAAITTCP
jgi:type IV fimbrial biogenesis protein FimT